MSLNNGIFFDNCDKNINSPILKSSIRSEKQLQRVTIKTIFKKRNNNLEIV